MGPLAPAGRVVRGSGDGLRVNMKSPNLQMNNAPSAFVALAQVPRHDGSSSSSFRCLRQWPYGDGEGPRMPLTGSCLGDGPCRQWSTDL